MTQKINYLDRIAELERKLANEHQRANRAEMETEEQEKFKDELYDETHELKREILGVKCQLSSYRMVLRELVQRE